jgi:hypothetical protein
MRPTQLILNEALRLPGLIGAAWIFVPFALSWAAGLTMSSLAMRESRPELIPFSIGLYGCVAFFAHAYSVGWRAGSWVWRFAPLLVAVTLLAVLALLHLDDSEARILYPQGALATRSPDLRFVWASGACLLAGALLLVHGFLLGLGSRAARARPRRLLYRKRASRPHTEADGDAQP